MGENISIRVDEIHIHSQKLTVLWMEASTCSAVPGIKNFGLMSQCSDLKTADHSHLIAPDGRFTWFRYSWTCACLHPEHGLFLAVNLDTDIFTQQIKMNWQQSQKGKDCWTTLGRMGPRLGSLLFPWCNANVRKRVLIKLVAKQINKLSL